MPKRLKDFLQVRLCSSCDDRFLNLLNLSMHFCCRSSFSGTLLQQVPQQLQLCLSHKPQLPAGTTRRKLQAPLRCLLSPDWPQPPHPSVCVGLCLHLNSWKPGEGLRCTRLCKTPLTPSQRHLYPFG